MNKKIVGKFNGYNIYATELKDKNGGIILNINNRNYPYEAIMRILGYDKDSILLIDQHGN